MTKKKNKKQDFYDSYEYFLFQEDTYIDSYSSKEDLELAMEHSSFLDGMESRKYRVIKGIELDVIECEPEVTVKYSVKDNV